jgi:agmatinase
MMAKVTQVGFVELPYERTSSFIHGTERGPSALVKEIERMDGFDFALGKNPFKSYPKIFVRPYETAPSDPFMEQAYSARAVSALLDEQVFPFCLGGEHTVSIGPIRAVRTRGELGVVQLDAHADLRNTYQGDYFSHACVMRRVLEMDCRLVNVGVRTVSAEEAALIKTRGLTQVDGRTAATSTDWYGVVDDLPERVYLSVDLDVFNPEEAPAVGAPEPGGPGYHAVVGFIDYLFKQKEVVAADLVELTPGDNDAATLRLAARLIGKIIALRFSATS